MRTNQKFGMPNLDEPKTANANSHCSPALRFAEGASTAGSAIRPPDSTHRSGVQPYSRHVNTTDRYYTGPLRITSIPRSAVASDSSESPARTATDLPPAIGDLPGQEVQEGPDDGRPRRNQHQATA